MEIEDLWDASDKNMPQYELDLKRVYADGEEFWRFSGRDTSDNYGEHFVDVDRKQLKDLHSAIEHELWPEQFIQSSNMRQVTIRAVVARMRVLGFSEDEMNEFIRKAQAIDPNKEA